MDPLVIEVGSPAWRWLHGALALSGTHKVSMDVRKDGIAFKRNEAMWTSTLSTSST